MYVGFLVEIHLLLGEDIFLPCGSLAGKVFFWILHPVKDERLEVERCSVEVSVFVRVCEHEKERGSM